MKYLLDTCVLLWALSDNKDKIGPYIDILTNEHNYVAVSVVSYWEIAIKKSLGKLESPSNLISVVEETGFSWINLDIKHIQELEKLPPIHSDPFDRLLVAQAKSDGFTLLTPDQHILRYFKTGESPNAL